MKRTFAVLLAAATLAPAGLATAEPSAPWHELEAAGAVQAAAVAANPSRLVPLAPARVLDTRTGVGVGTAGPITPGGTVDLQVNGQGGVPGSGVVAVVLNVTITEAVGPGYVQVVPAGSPLGTSSNLNVETAGQTIPNLVVAPVSTDGRVTLYAQAGGHLVADVLGAFVAATTATDGRYQALSPQRVLDTRTGAKPGPNGQVELQVAGQGGVPASGARAVALNVTATEATADGYVQVVPTGGSTGLGQSSNLNVRTGQTIANLVIVPLGNDGKVTLFTQSGTHLVADVTGWFTDDSAPSSGVGLFTPVTPERLLDTRSGAMPGDLSETAVRPLNRAGVPAVGVGAVALNVTATEATAPGYVQAFPTAEALPGTSSTLNVERAGQTIPNAAITTVGTRGTVSLFTQESTHLLADVMGWFSGGFVLEEDDPGTGEEPLPPPDPTGPLARATTPNSNLGLSSRLVFDTRTSMGVAAPSATRSVTVGNTGGQPLQITGVTVSPAEHFHLAPGAPTAFTVAPGASQDVGVFFRPAVNSAVFNGTLTMATNDPSRPTITVTLKGLNAEGYEGINEPTLSEILGTIGYNGIDVGSSELEFSGPENGPWTRMGSEVVAPYFTVSDPSQPVSMIPIATYTAKDPEPRVFYRATVAGVNTTVLTIRGDEACSVCYRENQKLFPATASGSTTFTMPAAQRFALGHLGYSTFDGTPNPRPARVAANCHTWRTYPAVNAAGVTIPATYVVAHDTECVNGDFNDFVFVVRNVVPAT